MKNPYIFRRKESPYWYLAYYDNGVLKVTSTKKTARDEAENFKNDYVKNPEILKPTLMQIKCSTFRDNYVELMSAFRKVKSLEAIKSALNVFISVVGDKMMSQYTSADVNNFLKTKLNQNRSPWTVHRYRAQLKPIFEYAIKENYLEHNPFENNIPINLPKKEVIFFTKEDLTKILNVLESEETTVHEKWLIDIIWVGLYTGMRLGELCSRKKEHILLDKRMIYVGNDENFTTKNLKNDFVPIADDIIPILEKHLLIHPEEPYLFYYTRIKYKVQPDNISHLFKKYIRLAGLNEKYSFHTLRKTTGSWLLQAGVPIAVISSILRHSSIRVTEEHYASLSKEYQPDINKISLK
jgi:integrase